MPYVEMGQGTYTSIPMLIAEELAVDLGQVRLEPPPNPKLYGNPALGGLQATGGSTSIRRRGARCAKRALLREPCWSRRRRSAGMSIPRPAMRRAAKFFTRRRGDGSNMASSPPTPPSCLPRKRRAQAAARVHADRHAGQAPGYAGEGQRNGRVRHRRSAPRSEDRDACAIAGLWRSGQERGR